MSLELTKLADLIENIALLGMSESEYEDERADIRDSPEAIFSDPPES